MKQMSVIEELATLFRLELLNSFSIVGNTIHLFMQDNSVIEIKAKRINEKE